MTSGNGYKIHPTLAVIGLVAFDIVDTDNLPAVSGSQLPNVFLSTRLHWGGCGSNQSIIIERLCHVYNTGRGAYLVTSLGPDYGVRPAAFQGYHRSDLLGALQHVIPVVHHSNENTTSFRLRRDRISGETSYDEEGKAIYDLTDSTNVDTLLTRLDEHGFPKIISITGIPAQVASTVIERINRFPVQKKPFVIYDPAENPIGEFMKNRDLYPTLGRVDLLRVNNKERKILLHEHEGPQRWVAQHDKVGTLVATKPREIDIYYREGSNIIRRTIRNGHNTIRADSLGCGDALNSAVAWHLDSQPNINPDTVRAAYKFGMAVVHDYMSQKGRGVGFTRFIPREERIREVEKSIIDPSDPVSITPIKSLLSGKK